MTTTLNPPRIRPKSFTYHTNVGEVQGRTATLSSEGKPPLWVSSPPEFKGEAGHWTPEDFFVASIEVCLMLTFAGLSEKRGLKFASYESSAEGLLGVIAGGSGTLGGPIVGAAIVIFLKNYVSAYIERWNMLLGFVFVFIVIFMPEGVVPGVRRLAAQATRAWRSHR